MAATPRPGPVEAKQGHGREDAAARGARLVGDDQPPRFALAREPQSSQAVDRDRLVVDRPRAGRRLRGARSRSRRSSVGAAARRTHRLSRDLAGLLASSVGVQDLRAAVREREARDEPVPRGLRPAARSPPSARPRERLAERRTTWRTSPPRAHPDPGGWRTRGRPGVRRRASGAGDAKREHDRRGTRSCWNRPAKAMGSTVRGVGSVPSSSTHVLGRGSPRLVSGLESEVVTIAPSLAVSPSSSSERS
jgi:hypothetical protein